MYTYIYVYTYIYTYIYICICSKKCEKFEPQQIVYVTKLLAAGRRTSTSGVLPHCGREPKSGGGQHKLAKRKLMVG